MKHLSLTIQVLVCLLLSSCTLAVLTPFSETDAPPELRVLVTLVTPQFEGYPEGTLYFLDVPEWDVIGVPAFVMDGTLNASFSVPSNLVVEGVPVLVLLLLEDPALCPEAPWLETTGFIIAWIMEERTAEFILDEPLEPWPCD